MGNARRREGAQFSRLFHITAATNMFLLVKYGKIYRHMKIKKSITHFLSKILFMIKWT